MKPRSGTRSAAALLIRLSVAMLGMVTVADVQSADKIYRVGYLSTGSHVAMVNTVDAFRQRLSQLGWVEGKNVVFDYRFAENRFEQLPELAAGLVLAKADVIIATPTAAALAAKKATKTIPIVFAQTADPVAIGLVANLGLPGGNVTGVAATFGSEIAAKRLQLLKTAVPLARRIAILSNPASASHGLMMENLSPAAASMDVSLQVLEVRRPEEFDAAFAAMTKQGAQALIVAGDPLFGTHAKRIADLAARNGLPTVYSARGEFHGGGLMFYGPSGVQQLRQAAEYVDKILRGAKPSDLPVEQPKKFDLVINLKTARALRVMIPQSLLLQADEVIE